MVVVAIALALGVATAYAQEWLPEQMGSLANSVGSWALVACALSLLATSGQLAAVFGSASLLTLLAVARQRQLCIRAVALSVGVTVLAAVVFVLVYTQNLLVLLP